MYDPSVEEFRPRGLWEALAAAVLRTTLQLVLKPAFSPRCSIPLQRRWLGVVARLTLVPPGVAIEVAELGGAGSVRGEWLRVRGATPAKPGVLLYLHGGAYCVGAARTHRALTARLAQITGLPVFAADYRLAPEHACPAALDDALAAFRALAALHGPVLIAGDSAGGGLALATAMALRDAGGPQPAALVLLSPWVDMDPAAMPPKPPRGEAMLSAAWAQACGAHYRGTLGADDPRVSPLRGRLQGLPPTLIQAGTDEMLHGQALQLHEALRRAGVASRCEVTHGRWHVFQLHGGALPSADDAINRIGRFVMQPLAQATPPTHSRHEVVILGAGMSGLCMAVQLEHTGLRDYVVVEKQPGLGGTWWDNTYPGAQVDVPAPVYSFSFAPNPRWSGRFADAPEIQAYMQRLAEQRHLLGRMRLGTRLTEARFDESSGLWTLRTERGDTLQARYFVCSTGPLNQPRWPDIPGLEAFQGQRLHSARWDAGVPLAGRRVAVIGTGSTASQLIPPLAAQAGRLHVFQRTANWVLPRLDRRYGALDRTLARLPPYAALVRAFWMQVLEFGRRGFDEGTLARRGMLGTASSLRERQLPDPVLREQLTPPYPLGCKRIIYSSTYYPALRQPNVELVTTPIQHFTAHGIVTRDGTERPLDVLVCATGFDTVHLLSSIDVQGRGGRTLREAWADGPEAYHGVTVAGFPNLFLMLGPNTATGHTSTLLYIEPEVQLALACMRRVKAQGGRWIEVRPEVHAEHNRQLQGRLADSVWSRCRSWYRMDNGRITALFPGFTREYVRALRNPDWADYRVG